MNSTKTLGELKALGFTDELIGSKLILSGLRKIGYQINFKYLRFSRIPHMGFHGLGVNGEVVDMDLVSTSMVSLKAFDRIDGASVYLYGGRTSIEGFYPDGKPIMSNKVTGENTSLCSRKDRFVKEVGRINALQYIAGKHPDLIITANA